MYGTGKRRIFIECRNLHVAGIFQKTEWLQKMEFKDVVWNTKTKVSLYTCFLFR